MIETWRFWVMSVTGPATESLTFSGCPTAMSDKFSAPIKNHFASLTDPRPRKVTYPLINISLLKNEKSQKFGVKPKQVTAGWNDDYIEQMLF